MASRARHLGGGKQPKNGYNTNHILQLEEVIWQTRRIRTKKAKAVGRGGSEIEATHCRFKVRKANVTRLASIYKSVIFLYDQLSD